VEPITAVEYQHGVAVLCSFRPGYEPKLLGHRHSAILEYLFVSRTAAALRCPVRRGRQPAVTFAGVGQDIHGWVEVAWNPLHDWAGVISVGVLVERNRMFWGWLLRDEGNFGPIAAQRGVTADASPEVRQRVAEVERFIESNEVHSFTWITWSELERINWDEGPLEGRQPMSLVLKGMVGEGTEQQPDLEPVQLLTRRDTLGDSPGWQLLFDLMRRLAQSYGADNVRIVAWFAG
jgi:hypothetical protein